MQQQLLHFWPRRSKLIRWTEQDHQADLALGNIGTQAVWLHLYCNNMSILTDLLDRLVYLICLVYLVLQGEINGFLLLLWRDIAH